MKRSIRRIGVIGHSLGGHNAMFVGAFDQRLKVIVSSCGWTPFHDYYGGKLAGWAQDRYMPRIRDVYGLNADRVPFDFYEVVAAFAPRGFFSNSPLGDYNFDVAGVKKTEPKVREIYTLLGAADKLQICHPNCSQISPPSFGGRLMRLSIESSGTSRHATSLNIHGCSRRLCFSIMNRRTELWSCENTQRLF